MNVFTGHGGPLLVVPPEEPKPRPFRHWPHVILDVLSLGMWLPVHFVLWFGRP